MVVSLLGARKIPVPLDLFANDFLRDDSSFAVREVGVRRLGLVEVELGAGIGGRKGSFEVSLDGWKEIESQIREVVKEIENSTLLERHKFDATHPALLQRIDVRPRPSLPLDPRNLLREPLLVPLPRLDTEDELVIARVRGARDELRALGVGTRDGEGLEAHDIPLHPGGSEAGDVLRDGDDDLAGLVAALFAAVELVLEVNCRDAGLSEYFCELHHSRKASVAV